LLVGLLENDCLCLYLLCFCFCVIISHSSWAIGISSLWHTRGQSVNQQLIHKQCIH
jgi:hypothetical protein